MLRRDPGWAPARRRRRARPGPGPGPRRKDASHAGGSCGRSPAWDSSRPRPSSSGVSARGDWCQSGDSAMVTYREAAETSGSLGYTDYSVDVPRGWRREGAGAGVQWTDPQGDRLLASSRSAVTRWRACARPSSRPRNPRYPGYRLLRLEALPPGDRPAALLTRDGRDRPANRNSPGERRAIACTCCAAARPDRVHLSAPDSR